MQPHALKSPRYAKSLEHKLHFAIECVSLDIVSWAVPLTEVCLFVQGDGRPWIRVKVSTTLRFGSLEQPTPLCAGHSANFHLFLLVLKDPFSSLSFICLLVKPFLFTDSHTLYDITCDTTTFPRFFPVYIPEVSDYPFVWSLVWPD